MQLFILKAVKAFPADRQMIKLNVPMACFHHYNILVKTRSGMTTYMLLPFLPNDVCSLTHYVSVEKSHPRSVLDLESKGFFYLLLEKYHMESVLPKNTTQH